jgi:hypothetical protein
MADGAEPRTAHYSAFISYSRVDVAAARRIHSALESYRLPQRLHPENQAWNPATRRLKPVFRDHDELTAAPDLGDAIKAALAQSEFLIVLCTPASAKSDWVGREIEMFRALHGDKAILAALVDGSPAEAFHPALAHGSAGGADLHPLAADFRPNADGKRLALLKLVAVLAGVGLGDLVQRDAQRRMRTLALAGALAFVVLAVIAVLTVLTLNARLAAEKERARGSALSGYMLEDLRTELKSAGRLDLLQALNKGVNNYYAGQDLSQLSDAELELRAKLLLAMGEDDEQRGDLAKARENIEEARRTTAKLLAAKPDDSGRIFNDAQSQYYVGMINWRLGDSARAEKGFLAYRALADQLVRQDSNKADWQMELGFSESNLGIFALRSRLDLAKAERHFEAALAAFRRAERAKPGDASIVSSVADGEAWLADTRRLSGDFAGARAGRARQKALLQGLAAADPLNRVVLSDLVANDLAIARIALAEGEPEAALESLGKGRAIAQRLAENDPENVTRAAQVRIFDLMKLRAWLDQPAARRPSTAIMAGANGDCADDRLRLKSDELATYCSILAAHRAGLAPPAILPSADGNRLTPNWGLNFTEEVKRVPQS